MYNKNSFHVKTEQFWMSQFFLHPNIRGKKKHLEKLGFKAGSVSNNSNPRFFKTRTMKPLAVNERINSGDPKS